MAAARKKRKRRGKPVTDPKDGRRRGFANLKPIEPGEVRNPEGKNGSEWLKAFRQFWEGAAAKEKLPKGAVKPEAGEDRYGVALRALFRNVAMGDAASIKLTFEQLQGRARQHIELSGDVGNGPKVEFLLPPNGRDVGPAAVQEVSGESRSEGHAEGPGEPEGANE